MEEFEVEEQRRRATQKIRALYFGVADVALRKELIAKDREEGELALAFWQVGMTDAARKLSAARTTGKRWWLATSALGTGFIAIGFYLFGIIGALGGLIVGYFCGRNMEQSALQARQSAIAEAEKEVKEAEQDWDKARNEPQTFSRREAGSGEPDQDERRLFGT